MRACVCVRACMYCSIHLTHQRTYPLDPLDLVVWGRHAAIPHPPLVHVPPPPPTGHYVSLIKSGPQWLFFDDENVEPITESQVQSTFGSTSDYNNNMDHGYILFYERVGPPA